MGFTSARIIAPLEDEMTAAGYGDPGYVGYLAGVEPRPFEHVRGRSLVGNKTTTTYTFDDWGNPQMIVERRGVYRDSFAPKVEYLGGPPAPRRGSVERIQGETIVIRDESE